MPSFKTSKAAALIVIFRFPAVFFIGRTRDILSLREWAIVQA